MTAPQKVIDLVERFKDNLSSYKDVSYKLGESSSTHFLRSLDGILITHKRYPRYIKK